MSPTPPSPPPEPGTPTQAAIRNVDEIAQLEREFRASISRSERIGLRLTRAAGTIQCLLLHLLMFAAWATWNVVAPPALRFDPYPFGLMTMVVSLEGVILAILVLTTQNRLSVQTDRRDHLNLQVGLLAEQEMTMVLRMLDRISHRLGAFDDREHEEARELMERTNIYELMEELRRRLR
jgi:uncharacterized membrane protein